MDWKDISLNKYYKIQELLAEPDDYTALNLIDLIYDIDSSELTVNQIANYSLEFLKQPIPNVKLNPTYFINGTEYESNFNLTEVKTNQFIDFQNYMKEEQPKLENMLSVFFIPSGCDKYNEGYDLSKVKSDMLRLPITVVSSAAFFFERQLQIFSSHFQHCLIKSLRKMKMDKMMKKQLLNQLKKMDLASMVSYHWS